MGEQDRTGCQGTQYGIQIVRGWAALAVVLHHMLEVSNNAAGRFSPDWLTMAGSAGVDLFFVISGFIMLYTTYKSGRPKLTAGPFITRRAIRIYPIYWICCLAMIVVWGLGFQKYYQIGFWDSTRAMALLPGGPPIIAFSWTLTYEVYFYILFSLTLLIAGVTATLAVAATVSVIVAIMVVASLVPDGGITRFLAGPLPLEFCFGLLIAWWHARGGRRHGARSWLVVAAVLIVLGSSALLQGAGTGTVGLPDWPRVALWGIPAVMIVVASLDLPGRPGRAFQGQLLLGDASYAIYLTHCFVMIAYTFALKFDPLRTLPQLPVVIGATLVSMGLGVATHIVIERPVTWWLAERARCMTGSATAPRVGLT